MQTLHLYRFSITSPLHQYAKKTSSLRGFLHR